MTYPKGDRGECLQHRRIRCGDCEYVAELEEENKRYKQALEFYADKKTYNLGVKFSMGTAHPRHEPIKFDQGEKARQALEGDSK